MGAEMTKGAAEVAASSLDEDIATAEALLRSQTFQQRLDQARAARERALQSKAPDELSAATLSKPWEKPLPARQRDGSEPAARRMERAAPTLFFPAGSAPASVANAAQPFPERPIGTHVSQEGSPQAQAGRAPPKSGLLRTAIGFSLGLGIGLAVAYFAIQPSPAPSQTSAAAAPVSPVIDAAVPAGPYVPETLLAGAGQADVPVITPTSAEGQPKMPLADTPATLAPEVTPTQTMALVAGAPTVWWPETGNLAAVSPEPALPVVPQGGGPIGAIRTPAAVGIARAPEPAPAYGQEARTPPVASPAPLYPGLSVKILSPAATDASDLTELAGTLTKAGFPSPDIGQVSYTIRQTHVRYYHGADAEAAMAIAAQLGTEARDFSQSASNAPDGLIEIWVAPAASALAQTTAQPVATAKPAPVQAAAKPKPAAKKPAKAAAKPDTRAAEAAEAAKLKARILLMLQSSKTP